MCPGVQDGDVLSPTVLNGATSGPGMLQEDARNLWWGIIGKSRGGHTRGPVAVGQTRVGGG